MDLPPHLSQAADTGESVSSYHSHGFTPTSPILGTAADTSFYSEKQQQQQQQQYDYDNNSQDSDDHDNDDDEEEEEEVIHSYGDALPEIETAYSEARARGLPDGWTCSIDVCILYMLSLLFIP